MRRKLSDTTYILGIDGGGSKTDAVILDERGNVVGAGLGGGCNANFMSRRAAGASYKRAIKAALKEAGISADMIAKAGCTFGSVADQVFAELGILVKAKAYSEYPVAFERAGIRELRGVALVAGTGSSCVAVDPGKGVVSAGGWGPIFGDEGSAYDIGLQGIKQSLLAQEGRSPETLLSQEMRDYFGSDRARGAVRKLFDDRINQTFIAGFAVRVSKAAAAGDQVSKEIIESAAESLGELAAFVARKYFNEHDAFPFVLAGGVFNIGKPVVDPIRAVLRPQFPASKIIVADRRPGEAVARLVAREDFTC